MAQAGYTPISLYYSTTSTQEPTAGNLVSGELAINIADGKLFYKNSAGNVRLLSIGYGSSSVTPTNGGVQYGTGTALALTAAGSSGQILRSNGAAAPTWADLSTLGVNTISFGTTGLTPNSATAGAVTVAGTLVTANGGTGLGGATPFTANGVLYASSASALTSGSALTFNGTSFGVPNIDLNNGGTQYFYSSGFGSYFALTNNANALTFGYNGSEQMRLTSTGLKVGTTSDFSSAKVVTDGGGIGILNKGLLRSSTNGVLQVSADPNNAYASSQISFDVDGSTVATLDSSGNLGLGVTPSAWLSTRKAFQNGNAAFVSAPSVPAFFQLSANTYTDSGGTDRYISSAASTNYAQVNGAHQWFTAPSGTAGNAITFTQALTLDASGNLGVGQTSPTSRVHVTKDGTGNYSEAYFTNANSTAAFAIGVGGSAVSASALQNNAYLYNVNNSAMVFGTNNTERARITSDGNLLVGTTSQIGRFAVNGAATSDALVSFYSSTAGDVGQPGLIIGKQDNNTTTSQIILRATILSSGAGAGQINMNGANTLAFGTYSDARLKENITDLPSQLANIMALRPVEFDYIESEGGGHQIGFIAQEMQQVYPDAVGEREDGMLTVSAWSKTEARLVKAIQEQQALITSLTARVALLEGN